MALWDKVVQIANKSMEDKAQQILDEVYERGYHWYPDSQNVVPSFHIMGSKSGAEVARRYGLITSIIIGSELREAYWAVYGNGHSGSRIYPHGRALAFMGQGKYRGGGRGKGGKYVLPSVKAYKGHDFLKEVANRHR